MSIINPTFENDLPNSYIAYKKAKQIVDIIASGLLDGIDYEVAVDTTDPFDEVPPIKFTARKRRKRDRQLFSVSLHFATNRVIDAYQGKDYIKREIKGAVMKLLSAVYLNEDEE